VCTWATVHVFSLGFRVHVCAQSTVLVCAMGTQVKWATLGSTSPPRAASARGQRRVNVWRGVCIAGGALGVSDTRDHVASSLPEQRDEAA